MAVNVPGLIAVIIFYVLILVIGLWAARKTKGKDNEDMMLAGRNIGMTVGIFTMTATWVGGGFINGSAEAVYVSGLVWCQAPFGYAASMWFGGYFFAKRMRTLGYVTMLDPLQQKYGKKMGALLYIPPLSGDIFWSGAILGALGTTLSVIIDLDYNTAVIISAGVAVFYTLFGGLYSVAYTDVIQLLCIFVGLWLTVPFAMTHDAVTDISVNYTSVWIKDLDPRYSGQYIDSFLLLILGGVGWQVYFQRVFSAKTSRIAELLSYAAGFGCIFLTIPAVLIGAIAANTNWNETGYYKATDYRLPDGDERYTLPLVMQYLCPTAVSFFGLGAVAAAVMSSADSSVLSASGMFSRNIYGAVIRPKASDNEITWVMRIAIVGIGSLATIMAIQVGSIYDLFVLCSDFVYVMLFPQLTCVIYFSDMNTYGSLAGYIMGLFVRLAGGEKTLSIPTLIKFPWYDETENSQLFPFKTFSTLTTFFFIFLGSYCTNYIFEKGLLPAKCDIFKCVVNLDDKKEKLGTVFSSNSLTTINTSECFADDKTIKTDLNKDLSEKQNGFISVDNEKKSLEMHYINTKL
ncbi:high-affinity choline transporter 1-like [Mytilus trossulus]|uniref:high-affinity choline transporter 1-like n=1 Tax=Mytilus trossulus TaxID=6551 RepID=UPI003006AE14